MPVDQLTNIKMSRLRLTLVDGHRVNPAVWTPESKWCQRHPAWPGGNYQHEFGLIQKTVPHVPPGSYFHTPRYTTNISFATITPLTSMDHNKASSSRYSCRFQIFFYEVHRRHPDRSLTVPSSLLKYAIPGDNDKPCSPQLYERFLFLLNMLWSRHVKPSSAKGEKRLKRSVQPEALPESEIMYKSKDHCTGMKNRITRDREIQRYFFFTQHAVVKARKAFFSER